MLSVVLDVRRRRAWPQGPVVGQRASAGDRCASPCARPTCRCGRGLDFTAAACRRLRTARSRARCPWELGGRRCAFRTNALTRRSSSTLAALLGPAHLPPRSPVAALRGRRHSRWRSVRESPARGRGTAPRRGGRGEAAGVGPHRRHRRALTPRGRPSSRARRRGCRRPRPISALWTWTRTWAAIPVQGHAGPGREHAGRRCHSRAECPHAPGGGSTPVPAIWRGVRLGRGPGARARHLRGRPDLRLALPRSPTGRGNGHPVHGRLPSTWRWWDASCSPSGWRWKDPQWRDRGRSGAATEAGSCARCRCRREGADPPPLREILPLPVRDPGGRG